MKTMSGRIDKRKAFLIIFIILICAVIYYFYFHPKKAILQTYTIQNTDIDVKILATGVLLPKQEVEVGAQVSGQLKRLSVKEGDVVTKGQLLAEIDQDISLNSLSQAEANYTVLKAQVSAAKADLSQKKRDYGRYSQLALTNAISEKDLADAKTNYVVSQAKLDQLEAELIKAQIDVKTAKKNLTFTQITAPIDGTVMDVISKEGQTLIASLQAPVIMHIAELSQMTVEAKVSEADIVKVMKGSPVTFSVFGEPDYIYYGFVEDILPSPEITNSSVYYNTRFTVNNLGGKLKKNMTADVSIYQSRNKNVPAIPASYIKEKNRRMSALVINEQGSQERKFFTVGDGNLQYVEVTEGLKAGDTIIVNSIRPEEDITTNVVEG